MYYLRLWNTYDNENGLNIENLLVFSFDVSKCFRIDGFGVFDDYGIFLI